MDLLILLKMASMINNNKSKCKAQQKINTFALNNNSIFNQVIISHSINNNYLLRYNLTKLN